MDRGTFRKGDGSGTAAPCDEGPPVTHHDLPVLYIDRPITRRKRFHVVEWPDGTPNFASRSSTECIEQIDILGFEAYLLALGGEDEPSRIVRKLPTEEH